MQKLVFDICFKLALLSVFFIISISGYIQKQNNEIRIMKIGYESNGMATGGNGEIIRDYYNGERTLKQFGLINYKWRYPFLDYPLKPIEYVYITGEKGMRNVFGYWEHVNSTDFVSMQNYLVHNMIDGIVYEVDKNKIYGNYVIVFSTLNYNNQIYFVRIRYSHLSIVYVKKGQYILQDFQFAVLGNTGKTNKTKSYNGVHLDLEIMLNGQYVNPFSNTILHKRVEL